MVWRAGDGPKPTAEHLTPREADQALAAILSEAPTVLPTASETAVTFEPACLEWLRYVERDRQRAPSTVTDYRYTVNTHLLPAFGASTPLAQIDTEAVDAFRETLLADGGLSRRTVQETLVLLHGVMNRAVRRKWIETNPAAAAERVNLTRSGDFNVITPEQVAAVVRAIEDRQAGAVVAVAAFTGLRLGELRALCWSDVEFAKRLVHVRRNFARQELRRPKSQTVRSVPMIDQVAATFDELSRRERFVADDDYVFCDAIGRPLGDQAMRRPFYQGLEDAGLGELRRKAEPMVFHDLRHTFGTLAVQAFLLSDVMAYMGHAHIQTTMIYVHHIPRHDAAQRLSAVAGGRPDALDGLRRGFPAGRGLSSDDGA